MKKITKFLIIFALILSILWNLTFSFEIFPEDISNQIETKLKADFFAVLKNKNIESSKEEFQNLCLDNLFTCFKVRFDGNFDRKEKYIYLGQVVYLNNFFEEHFSNFEDSYKKITFTKDSSKRGYQAGNEILINVVKNQNYNQTFQVLTHEMFHIWDLNYLKGESSIKNEKFTEFGRKKFEIDDPSIDFYQISWNGEKTLKNSNTENFCSIYGKTDTFEDLAECGNFYLNHYKTFKLLASKNPILEEKFKFFHNFFGGDYIQADYKNVDFIQNNFYYRPYDSTKF